MFSFFISRLKVLGAPLLCVVAGVACSPRPLQVAYTIDYNIVLHNYMNKLLMYMYMYM